MTFLIVTHVIHKSKNGKFYGYAPYIKEMNLWIQSFSRVILIAPVLKGKEPNAIEIPYIHSNLEVINVQELDLTQAFTAFKSLLSLPLILGQLFKGMKVSDHIHLRCPGNMGLLGCVVQMFFPKKKKTAKYAGNWDPNSQQPFTYKLQRRILNNSTITKNMKALVYGSWPGDSANILPFFTASYSQNEILPLDKTLPREGKPLNLIFVGSLVSGKNPLIALEVLKLLIDQGMAVHLNVCGDGEQMQALKTFAMQFELVPYLTLHGNVNASQLKALYQESHFLIFLSDSEGWPKVVAESMFFGCVPLTTAVSCVPEMLGFGERGDLISKNPEQVQEKILYYLRHPEEFKIKSEKAKSWSNQYTLEMFQSEIKKLI
jgi:glycosyltransferase involved in cell wall biosynthesis